MKKPIKKYNQTKKDISLHGKPSLGVLEGAMHGGTCPECNDETFIDLTPINVDRKGFQKSVMNLFDVALEQGISFTITFQNGIAILGEHKSRKRSKK